MVNTFVLNLFGKGYIASLFKLLPISHLGIKLIPLAIELVSALINSIIIKLACVPINLFPLLIKYIHSYHNFIIIYSLPSSLNFYFP